MDDENLLEALDWEWLLGSFYLACTQPASLSKEENPISVSSTNTGQFYSCLLPAFGLHL